MLNQSFIIYIQIIYIIKIGVPSPTAGNLCGVITLLTDFVEAERFELPNPKGDRFTVWRNSTSLPHFHNFNKSSRQDSNLRHRGPKPRPLDLSDTTR